MPFPLRHCDFSRLSRQISRLRVWLAYRCQVVECICHEAPGGSGKDQDMGGSLCSALICPSIVCHTRDPQVLVRRLKDSVVRLRLFALMVISCWAVTMTFCFVLRRQLQNADITRSKAMNGMLYYTMSYDDTPLSVTNRRIEKLTNNLDATMASDSWQQNKSCTRPFSRSFQTNPKRNYSTPDPVTPLIRRELPWGSRWIQSSVRRWIREEIFLGAMQGWGGANKSFHTGSSESFKANQRLFCTRWRHVDVFEAKNLLRLCKSLTGDEAPNDVGWAVKQCCNCTDLLTGAWRLQFCSVCPWVR